VHWQVVAAVLLVLLQVLRAVEVSACQGLLLIPTAAAAEELAVVVVLC